MIRATKIRELPDDWKSFRASVQFDNPIDNDDALNKWLSSKFSKFGGKSGNYEKIAGAILFCDKNIAMECYLKFSAR